MMATLHAASASNAYVLSDRGTWISCKNRGELDIVVQGDKRLFNQYDVILMNPRPAPACEGGLGPSLHRLADFARGQERDRGLQDRGPTALRSQWLFVPGLMQSTAPGHPVAIPMSRS
jgi:hypothetical protein